ncbi:MAG: hypothetical protein KA104_00350 [Candidatus Pacebacteria bacterium]|nr:hypothetical protein [Candidatus Paceibacterota bacterium]
MNPKKKWDWKDEEFLRKIGDLLIAGNTMREVREHLSLEYEDLPPFPTFTTRIKQTGSTPEDFKKALGEVKYEVVMRVLGNRTGKGEAGKQAISLRLPR